MRCPNKECNAYNQYRYTDKFCSQCGVKLVVGDCCECGFDALLTTDKFCANCGKEIQK